MNSRYLKHALAVAANLSLMGAAFNAAAAVPLTWSKGAVPANAVVAGGSKDKPMHICRLPMADKNLHTGKTVNDNCYVSYGGKEIKVPLKDAEVLGSSAAIGWADVKGGKLPADTLQSGLIGGVPMHFCRAVHEDKSIQAGKEYKGNCYYGYGGKEIKTAQFQVMGLIKAAATSAAPAVPAAVGAPATKAAATSAAPAAPAAVGAPATFAAGKPQKTRARWTAMLNAADTLAKDGSEVKRITAAEMHAIKATVAADKKKISHYGTNRFTEGEEDRVDNAIASLMVKVANAMSNSRKDRVHKTSAAASRKSNNHARWKTMLDVARSLAHDGSEVNRITANEKKSIADLVAKLQSEIKAKGANGFSEEEEDQIDNHIANMIVKIAEYMSDPKRK
jgi:hypothetical protein